MSYIDLTVSNSRKDVSVPLTTQWESKKITLIFHSALLGCAIGAGVFGPIGAVVGAMVGAALGVLTLQPIKNSVLPSLSNKLVSLLKIEKKTVPQIVLEQAARIIQHSPDYPQSTNDQFWMAEAYSYLSDPEVAFPADLAGEILRRFEKEEEAWKGWVEEEARKLGGKSKNDKRRELAVLAIQKHPRFKHYPPEDQGTLALKLCASQSFTDLLWGSSFPFDIPAHTEGMQPPYPNRFAALQALKCYPGASSQEIPLEDSVKLVYLAIKDKAPQNLTEIEKRIKLAYEYYVLKLY